MVLSSNVEEGVVLTQGGRFGGYALYLKNGRPVFHYNAIGTDQFTIAAPGAISPGKHLLKAHFEIDEPKPRSGGTLTLSVDGETVASGRIGRTLGGAWFSHTEGLDVGMDTITPVSEDYTVPTSTFTGKLGQVKMTLP